MDKNNDRGKLLYEGIKGKYTDTISGQKKVVAFIIFKIIILITLAICTILFNWTLGGSSILGAIVWLFFAGIFVLLLYACGGIDIDAIYENGISSAWHNLIDYLKGNTFHRYEDITKIGYSSHTFHEGKETYVISIFKQDPNIPAVPGFHQYRYKNDFYERLIETLKKKCPNVIWVKLEYMDLPGTRK